MSLSNEQRLDRLDTFIAEDRILRNAWNGRGDDGCELACLLTALSPEAGVSKSAVSCPAEVLPEWLAQAVPQMNDRVSDSEWPAFLDRFATTLRRIYGLAKAGRWTAEDWRRQKYSARAIALRCAPPRPWPQRQDIEAHIALSERAARGEAVRISDWTTNEAAMWAANAASLAAKPDGPRAMAQAYAKAFDVFADGTLASLEARCAELEAA